MKNLKLISRLAGDVAMCRSLSFNVGASSPLKYHGSAMTALNCPELAVGFPKGSLKLGELSESNLGKYAAEHISSTNKYHMEDLANVVVSDPVLGLLCFCKNFSELYSKCHSNPREGSNSALRMLMESVNTGFSPTEAAALVLADCVALEAHSDYLPLYFAALDGVLPWGASEQSGARQSTIATYHSIAVFWALEEAEQFPLEGGTSIDNVLSSLNTRDHCVPGIALRPDMGLLTGYAARAAMAVDAIDALSELGICYDYLAYLLVDMFALAGTPASVRGIKEGGNEVLVREWSAHMVEGIQQRALSGSKDSPLASFYAKSGITEIPLEEFNKRCAQANINVATCGPATHGLDIRTRLARESISSGTDWLRAVEHWENVTEMSDEVTEARLAALTNKLENPAYSPLSYTVPESHLRILMHTGSEKLRQAVLRRLAVNAAHPMVLSYFVSSGISDPIAIAGAKNIAAC